MKLIIQSFLICSIIFCSCSIEKRTVNRGYFIKWNNSNKSYISPKEKTKIYSRENEILIENKNTDSLLIEEKTPNVLEVNSDLPLNTQSDTNLIDIKEFDVKIAHNQKNNLNKKFQSGIKKWGRINKEEFSENVNKSLKYYTYFFLSALIVSLISILNLTIGGFLSLIVLACLVLSVIYGIKGFIDMKEEENPWGMTISLLSSINIVLALLCALFFFIINTNYWWIINLSILVISTLFFFISRFFYKEEFTKKYICSLISLLLIISVLVSPFMVFS